jgi:hypothetical protein
MRRRQSVDRWATVLVSKQKAGDLEYEEGADTIHLQADVKSG